MSVDDRHSITIEVVSPSRLRLHCSCRPYTSTMIVQVDTRTGSVDLIHLLHHVERHVKELP